MKKASMALVMLAMLPGLAGAGNLDASGAPATGSGMPSTADIYNRLDTGAAIAVPATFREPSAGPGAGTGKTLGEIAAKLPVADDANGAVAADVASGKTFWGLRTDGTWGPASGTRATPATGANVTGGNGALTIAIPDGVYSGGKTATATDGNLQPGNIKSGVSIFGVSGTLVGVDMSHVSSLVCANKWSGAGCDVCPNHWSGASCDTCPSNWGGASCNVCATGWTGANCDACANAWTGASCNVCPTGWSGANCDIIEKPFPTTMPSYASLPWKCVHDSATGLTWEVKTTGGGLHDVNATYNGGSGTDAFVAAVNAEQLCGYSDWRVPNRTELESLVVLGSRPTIDSAYFVNTWPYSYWTSTTTSAGGFVWYVFFYEGTSNYESPTIYSNAVRLVRSGP